MICVTTRYRPPGCSNEVIMSLPPMSEATTQGIHVTATPFYLPDESDPEARRYVFGYQIVITNEGTEAAQLLTRHWTIIDSIGRSNEIEGPGVVGQTPRLEPGQAFDYQSSTPLRTPWGTMEGTFAMQRDDGRTFDARVDRFYLAMPAREASAAGRQG